MSSEELMKAIEQNGSAAAVLLSEVLKYAHNMPFTQCKKIEPYLYELTYNDLDYEFGKKYAAERFIANGRCSVVQSGNFIGRNLDMLYDNSITAVIKVAADVDRYSSIGLVSGMSTLTRQLLTSWKYDDALKAAPFFVVDAINEKGLFAEINLLTREESKGRTTGTVPEIELRDKIAMPMLVRYIVDHFKNVDEAIDYIRNYVSVYASETEISDYEFHYFLADGTKSAILEFVNNESVVVDVNEDAYPSVMVNFYTDGVAPNAGGIIFRNTSDDPFAENYCGVTRYGQGIERHNLAVSSLKPEMTESEMKALMRDLFYTKTYTLSSNKWFTELVGKELTVTSPEAKFSDIFAKATDAYNNRDRNNPLTWQTIHSVVYDLENKSFTVCVQEGENYHTFSYDQTGMQLHDIVGELASLETDHKSNLVAAINELFDVLKTPELEISMMQSNAARKAIYDECVLHPSIAKNIVFFNVTDGMYYRVNGYKIVNNILYLHTIMTGENNTLRSILVQIGSNGSISVA